tara:strand:+ start:5129 stop:5485 length:357 start_codon:yes stop_codon:yes gene_type:complete
MSVQARINKALNKDHKVELSAEKIELSLMSDIDVALDAANAKRRTLIKLAKKVSDDLNNLTSDYGNAILIASKGIQAAKDLGADEAMKFFGNRRDEAKDYEKEVGKAANKIFAAVTSI